ncbi:MAG: DUF2155 domain-containing protein [Hyphomicrobiales bacterium]|nr:DUF2155 domain-containing protein [Hyphomicrobiales bacterium]
MRLVKPFLPLMIVATAMAGATGLAHADRIENPTATFAGLDKVTGRIIHFKAAIGETVQFGTLLITPRICNSRPATEAPETDSFIQVDEIKSKNKEQQIFSGWIFADSPGLNGIEHPIYDVWLKSCEGGTKVIVTAKPEIPAPSVQPAPATSPAAPGAANPPVAAVPAAPAPPRALVVQHPRAPVRRVIRRRVVPRQRFYPVAPPTLQGHDGIY